MKMIENGVVQNKADNEYGIYTKYQNYRIKNGMITDDRGDWTNFGNVRKAFKLVNLSERIPQKSRYSPV